MVNASSSQLIVLPQPYTLHLLQFQYSSSCLCIRCKFGFLYFDFATSWVLHSLHHVRLRKSARKRVVP